MSRGRQLAAAVAAVLGRPLAAVSEIRAADAIAILGAPLAADGGLTEVLEERVRVGVELWQRGLAPVVCVTGGGPDGRREAPVMAARALALGLPGDALRIDETATSTRQNAERVAELLFPGATVWIVTQPFHLRRAAREFRRVGLAPLTWQIQGSVQHRAPERALRWIAREYLALLRR